MMGGSVVVITAILARLILKELKYSHHIIGLALIFVGVGLVGLSSILW